MTDFAGLRPSIDKMSLSGVERLPYQDVPPQQEVVPDTFELLDKRSTQPLTVVSENETVEETEVLTRPKQSIIGRLLRALCLSSEA